MPSIAFDNYAHNADDDNSQCLHHHICDARLIEGAKTSMLNMVQAASLGHFCFDSRIPNIPPTEDMNREDLSGTSRTSSRSRQAICNAREAVDLGEVMLPFAFNDRITGKG